MSPPCNSADYSYDIFISYRRSDEDWIRWTRDNFVRALGSLLRPALGRIRIAFDEHLEVGNSWPAALAQQLASSKLMIAVLSRDYFESDWCKLEIALMRHREVLCGYRTGQNPRGLIIPVIIDDGDRFPPEVQEIQGQKIHDFANPFMRIDSPRQEEFAEVLRTKLCVDIQNAIQCVPAFDPKWHDASVKNFQARFKVQIQDTYALPTLYLDAST